MPEFFTNFAQPQQRNSLADMVNMAAGLQNFQQQQQLQPLQLEKARMEIEQLKKIQPLEAQRLAAEARVAEETAAPKISKAQSESETAATGSQKSKLELQMQKFLQGNTLLGSAVADANFRKHVEKGDSNAIIDYLSERKADLKKSGLTNAEVEGFMAPFMVEALKDPKGMIQSLTRANAQGMAAAERVGMMLPKLSTNAAGQSIAANPVTGQYDVMGTPQTNPMGQRSQIAIDPLTKNAIQVPLTPQGTFGAPSNIIGGTSQVQFGATGQPGGQQRPAANALMAIPAGENEDTAKQYISEAIAARNSALPAKTAINNIDTIIKYLPLAQTGKGSEAISGMQSVFGNLAGSTPEEKAAAARDIIQKNIASLSLQANQAGGGKYVESLKLAEQSLADAGKNPTAIVKSMEQLKPLMQHAVNYSAGLDRAIRNSSDKQFVKPRFDSEMNDAFDVKALQMKNAYDAGGQEGLKKFLNENKIFKDEQARLLGKLEKYQRLVKGEL